MEVTGLVIFDMDGVIFDSERACMEELRKVMREHGYVLTDDIYISTIGLTGEALKNKMQSFYGQDYPFKEISSKARQRVSLLAEEGKIEVKKGIPQLLEFLRQKGKLCSVASSTKSCYVDAYLRAAGIREYFKTITGGEEVENSKPAPDIFIRACRKENILPHEAIVIEDSPNGVRAALSAGIRVICIPDLAAPETALAEMAELVASDAFEAEKYLKDNM